MTWPESPSFQTPQWNVTAKSIQPVVVLIGLFFALLVFVRGVSSGDDMSVLGVSMGIITGGVLGMSLGRLTARRLATQLQTKGFSSLGFRTFPLRFVLIFGPFVALGIVGGIGLFSGARSPLLFGLFYGLAADTFVTGSVDSIFILLAVLAVESRTSRKVWFTFAVDGPIYRLGELFNRLA
jgi:hypothetical protein